MTSRTAPNTEERLEIAKEPALLAQGAELNQDPNRSTSLNVGSGANKAAVIIPKSLYKNSRAQNSRSKYCLMIPSVFTTGTSTEFPSTMSPHRGSQDSNY
jgi:hypothetical protein